MRESHKGEAVLPAAGAGRRSILSILLIAVLLAAGLLGTKLVDGYAADNPGVNVRVTDSDGTVRLLPLNKDTRLEISTSQGVNVVEVRDGSVSVIEADCPGGDCQRHAPITSAGQSIICLPHRLVVEIVGEEPRTDGAQTGSPQAEGQSAASGNGDAPTTDSGTAERDAGIAVRDAGAAERDAGIAERDAGAAERDAGGIDIMAR